MTPMDNLLVVAGMSRGGTSFLYHNLQKNRGFFLPARKEIGYFAYHYSQGDDWFRKFFAELEPPQVPVDICGVYFMTPEAPARIQSFAPDAKVILGIRTLSDWIFSLYDHYATLFDMPEFPAFLERFEFVREGVPVTYSFEPGRIARTIQTYQDTFGDR